MGISTDPDDWGYGNNCGCWDAGKTPHTIYGYVSGIKTGSGWVPAIGDPQNGGFHLHQINPPCYFSHTTDRNPNIYRTGLPGSQLIIGAIGTQCFVGSSDNNCEWYFVNDEQDPTRGFYGGTAIIFQREPLAGGAPSLAEIAELLNMDGRASRMSEGFPLDSSHFVAMFADQQESTRIRLKYDFT